MPTLVDVVGVGRVQFPDEMSQDDIAAAIRRQVAKSAPEPVETPEISPNDYSVEVVNDSGVPSAVIGGRNVPLQQLFPREGSTMAGEITPERMQNAIQQGLIARTQQASAIGERANTAEFQAPTQRPIPAAEQAELGRLESARNEFARSAFSSTLQPAQALSKLDEALFERSARPRLGEMAQERSKLFEQWQAAGREAFPTDPRYQGEFLASTLPQAAGSQVPFLLTGNVGGAGASALAGALMTAQQEYDAAKGAGASEASARKAALVGLPIGLSEGFGGIGKGAGAVKGGFKGWLHSIAEENLQELGQTVAQQLNATYVTKYDPDKRMTGKDILDVVAATTVLTGAHSALPAYVNRNQKDSSKPGEVVEDTPVDLGGVDKLFQEETTNTGVQPEAINPTEQAPPLVVTPTHEAAARSLGADPVELRQQEAIAAGQPLPQQQEQEAAPFHVTVHESEASARRTAEANAGEFNVDVALNNGKWEVRYFDKEVSPEAAVATEASPEGQVTTPESEGQESVPVGQETGIQEEVTPVYRKNLQSTEPPVQLSPEEQAVFERARAEMKKVGKENGGTSLPQIIMEAGHTLYRKGMDFAEWSVEMVKQLGEAIKPHLETAWKTITETVNAASPAARRFKKSGTIGKAQSDEVYSVFSDDVHRAKTDTKPNQDFNEADKQAVVEAYQSLQEENKQGSQRIADVMERAGLPLSGQSKGLVIQMFNEGKITGLAAGDWSLSNSRTRAWGVRRLGDVALRMEIPAGMKRSAQSPEGGAIGGQGGRRTGESEPAAPEVPEGASIANASMEEVRRDLGMDPRVTPFRRRFSAVWDEAMARIAKNPDAPADLVQDLMERNRSIEDFEGALLLHRRVTLENKIDVLMDAVNSSQTEAEAESNNEKLKRASQDLALLAEVTANAGTATARGLAIRQMTVDRSLSLSNLLRERQANFNKGKKLSEEQVEEVTALYERLNALQKELDKVKEEQSKTDAKATFASMMKEVNKERKEAKKAGKTVTEFLNEQADKSRAALKELLGTTNVGVNPAILWHVSVIGASHIANGINTATEYAAKLIEEFGQQIAPYTDSLYEQSKAFHDQNKKNLEAATSTTATVEPEVETEVAAKVEKTPEQLLEGAKAELDPKLVFQLVRAYVRGGMEGADNVIAKVHTDLAKLIPDLTVREVRDAFTGYGKVTFPSQEADKKKIRAYKEILRLTSQLEDVEKRMAPLRTGPQRDKMTVAARELQKRIAALMKQYGIQSTSPEQQLKSAIDAVKTRLRNEIEELDRAIATRTPRPVNKTTLQYDAEAKALRDQRDRKKAQYDAIFTPPGKTAEEKIAARLKALDQAVAEEAQLLREGILKRPPQAAPVTSPEIENKVMELDALRQLRRELYAATQPYRTAEDIALANALKAAKASRERLDEMLRTGNIDPKTNQPKFTPTQELEAIWSERDAMRDALMELRKAQKPRTDPEERARKATIKALEKSVKNLEDRIFNKDFSTQQRKVTRSDTKEISDLRDLRDQMRKIFTDLKKAQTPVRSKREISLARDKKNILNRTKKLQDKIDAGDYTPAPKRTPEMDREKRKLQFEYQDVREQYLKGLFEEQLKQRSLGGKVVGTAAEIMNTFRGIMASSELSGVGRQGGFILFSRPVRAIKALSALKKALRSPEGLFEVQQEIKDRENYQEGKYQRDGLYLADNAPASLSKMEEAYMGRWVRELKGLKGAAAGAAIGALQGIRSASVKGTVGGIVAGGVLGYAGWAPATERAYVAFLNKIRADSYDAMELALTKNGVATDEEGKAIANFVNAATGRGDLGFKVLRDSAEGLNTLFFAPKYIASRLQLLTLQPMWGGSNRTRKLIAMEYARFLTGAAIVLSLLAVWRDKDDPKMETDPRSSDFGKVLWNNTHLDIFTGLLQNITFASRLFSGATKKGGKVVPLTGDVGYRGDTRGTVLYRYLRSKLAPVPAIFNDWAFDETVTGDKFTWRKALERSTAPMSAQDIQDSMMDLGADRGTAAAMLIFLGIGANTYKPRAQSQKADKDPYAAKEIKGY